MIGHHDERPGARNARHVRRIDAKLHAHFRQRAGGERLLRRPGFDAPVDLVERRESEQPLGAEAGERKAVDSKGFAKGCGGGHEASRRFDAAGSRSVSACVIASKSVGFPPTYGTLMVLWIRARARQSILIAVLRRLTKSPPYARLSRAQPPALEMSSFAPSCVISRSR